GAWSAFVVALSGGDVTAPFVAVAVLTIEPASRSACTTECEALHVSDWPGASDAVGGHVTVTRLSATVNGPARGTLPLFVTVYEYEITWPRNAYDVGETDLSSESPGVGTIGMARPAVAAGAWFDVTVTVFASTPLPAVGEPFASSSACVNA